MHVCVECEWEWNRVVLTQPNRVPLLLHPTEGDSASCSFSSNLFVPFPCTCACHSRLGIKMNEPPVLVFILSAQAVIKTAAARIVVACRWYDWYDVKARGGKFPGVKLMGDSPKWRKWKMKISYYYDGEHEQNNTGPPSVYVVTFQQKCAQCLLTLNPISVFLYSCSPLLFFLTEP